MSYPWPGRGGPNLDYITAPPVPDGRRVKSVAILGSTGSIGNSALDIVKRHPDKIKVAALAAGRNIRLLMEQARLFRPDYLAVQSRELADRLELMLPKGYAPEILWGQQGYMACASLGEVELVVSAQSGSAGLAATMAAAEAAKTIALANKESLVLAGELLRRVCNKTGASILPVDSEHYAIFQCLSGQGQNAVKLVLTASGGPFRGKPFKEIYNKTAREALRHPNWSMGKKISIDSATLMNKGLEVIEAMQLYGVSLSQVEVLVHPQSIVHSLVEFGDNSLLAQLGVADMRLPIAACMFWPDKRVPCVERLDLVKAGALSFYNPDSDAFPCFRLAMKACEYMPSESWRFYGLNPAFIILNGANEKAVELFLENKCLFGEIPELIRRTMQALLPGMETPHIGEDIMSWIKAIQAMESEAAEYVTGLVEA